MTLRSDNPDSFSEADLEILKRVATRIATNFPGLALRLIDGAVRNAAPVGVIDEKALERDARRALMTPSQLKSARHILGLSAEAFASLVGVESGGMVRRWESGDRDIPGPVIVLTWLLIELPAVREHLGLGLTAASVTSVS
jgi:DNA-binding transcriptional regulator YiaG